MRLSNFHKSILYIAVYIIIVYLISLFGDFIVTISLACAIAYVMVLFMSAVCGIDELINFRYRIEETDTIKCYYRTNKFIFFIMKQSVETEYSSSSYENIFGGKSYSSYTWDVRYDSIEEAKQAIEKHKLEMKEKRKAFFRRPEKKIKKIIKM